MVFHNSDIDLEWIFLVGLSGMGKNNWDQAVPPITLSDAMKPISSISPRSTLRDYAVHTLQILDSVDSSRVILCRLHYDYPLERCLKYDSLEQSRKGHKTVVKSPLVMTGTCSLNRSHESIKLPKLHPGSSWNSASSFRTKFGKRLDPGDFKTLSHLVLPGLIWSLLFSIQTQKQM